VFGGAGFIGTHLREGVCSNGTSLPLATLRVTKSLHRIEESALRREVEAAGFKLVAEGDFWRHPEDARDFSIQPPSGKAVDEFVLKFQKPM
jgi:predicted methyltransferase